MTLKIAVLISGRGSNLQALIDAAAEPGWPAGIVLVISNEAEAQGLKRAEKAGIPATVINHRDFDGREPFDQAMTEAIKATGAELVCLAGFMRLLSDSFVDHWRDRLINIHPSLLPAFKGLDVHQRVIDAGEEASGCTVHFVRPEMDTGPIIAQARVPVHPGDDADTLAARILEQEHEIYPRAVRLIAEGRVTVEGEKAVIQEAPGEVARPGVSPDNQN
ncbi:MAG: phosphoribosylglycinamide formyltransferase [Rhodospirillales bacterium]